MYLSTHLSSSFRMKEIKLMGLNSFTELCWALPAFDMKPWPRWPSTAYIVAALAPPDLFLSNIGKITYSPGPLWCPKVPTANFLLSSVTIVFVCSQSQPLAPEKGIPSSGASSWSGASRSPRSTAGVSSAHSPDTKLIVSSWKNDPPRNTRYSLAVSTVFSMLQQ